MYIDYKLFSVIVSLVRDEDTGGSHSCGTGDTGAVPSVG